MNELVVGFNKSIHSETELTGVAVESKRREAEMEASAEQFLASHIRYEAWMGKKRRESKRNGHERAMNQLAERLKKGERVSIRDFNTVSMLDGN